MCGLQVHRIRERNDVGKMREKIIHPQAMNVDVNFAHNPLTRTSQMFPMNLKEGLENYKMIKYLVITCTFFLTLLSLFLEGYSKKFIDTLTQ